MVSSQTRLAVFGVALHALLIYAMFDVHFITPLVHGMEPTTADFAAPASRLVVIVADGLRADRLFELEDAPGDDPDAPRVPRAPFLPVWRNPAAAGASATPGRPRNLAPGTSRSWLAFTRTRAPSRRDGKPTPWS